MPRIRSVKPEFWTDTKLARLPALTRLVFLCLIGMADDEGRIEGDAESVWHFGFPRERIEDVRNALGTLLESSRVVAYKTDDGTLLLALPNFRRHQRIDKPQTSKLPAPPIVTLDSKSVLGTIQERSRTDWMGSDGMGEDGNGGEGTRATRAEPPPVQSIPSTEPGPGAVSIGALSDDLASRTEEPADLCGKALRELAAVGVPLDRIRSRIEAIGEPIGVWAWKAAVLAGWRTDQPAKPSAVPDHGPKFVSSGGATAARIAADKARAAADLEAFQSSGFATRSEYLKAKAGAS